MNLRLLKEASWLIKCAYNVQPRRAALDPNYSDYDQVYDYFYKEDPRMAEDNTAQYIVDNFGADPAAVNDYVGRRQFIKGLNSELNQTFDQTREAYNKDQWQEYDRRFESYLNGYGNTPPKMPTESYSYPDYKNYQEILKQGITDMQNEMNQNSTFLKGKGRENLRRFLNEPEYAQ